MKYFILILLFNAIKCEGSCGFDNKTAELFWKKRFSFVETFPLDSFLIYHKIKRKLESVLNLNHPNLQCDIYEICNKNFSYEACSYCEENYDDYFSTVFSNDFDRGLDDFDFSDYDIEVFLEYYTEFDIDSIVGEFSFCEMFFMFEHKTKFVFLIDHFEVWLFSHRNFTIHSNQLIKKSGSYFFTTR